MSTSAHQACPAMRPAALCSEQHHRTEATPHTHGVGLAALVRRATYTAHDAVSRGSCHIRVRDDPRRPPRSALQAAGTDAPMRAALLARVSVTSAASR